MADPNVILQEMIDNVEDQSENLASSITQVEKQRDALNVEIDGVQNGMCAVAESDLTAYMNGTKVPELEITWGGMFTTPFVFTPGGNYGSINFTTGGITDWQVLDALSAVVYEYQAPATNWDGDTFIEGKINDFAFGNDYLTRPLASGATYGLIPSRDNLNVAKSILEDNKDKIDASVTAFADYT